MSNTLQTQLLIIGGGPGGYIAGIRAGQLGVRTIVVEGVASLHGTDWSVICDRIEAGTYAVAGAMAGGEVRLTKVRPELISILLDKLVEAGCEVHRGFDTVTIKRSGTIKPVDVTTDVYPGFATDLQAQFMALMTLATGESVIKETIFENRFMHVPELSRLGADIRVTGSEARVHGVTELRGAQVMATDLRASACLVIAGLAARGETTVNRVYHLDRGFENLEGKLSACGAKIRRIKGDEPVMEDE